MLPIVPTPIIIYDYRTLRKLNYWLLPIHQVVITECRKCSGGYQSHSVHTDFHKNNSNRFKVKMADTPTHTHTHTQT